MVLNHEAVALLDSLSAMGNFVEVVDQNGIYLYCSENCVYDADCAGELVGKHVLDAFDLTESNSVLLDTLRTKKPHQDIFLRYISRKTGKDHYWLYNSFPIILDGQLQGALALYRTVDGIKNVIQDWQSLTPQDKKKRGDLSQSDTGLYTFDDILCTTEDMLQAVSMAKRVARRNASVLLTGETGTGKELFAQSIHSYSLKRSRPFVAVNCAAIPDNLLESILFGVSKGAYTGAVEKPGLFEESKDGTIFLDELQALHPEMQAKLLRVLETKKIRRVGGNQEIDINPRVISAMNVNPLESIASGKLKADLFYRIAVVTIEIPQLRNRQEDVPILVQRFMDVVNQEFEMKIDSCSPRVWRAFASYPWPGNVRELKHVVEFASNMMDDHETKICARHLPCHFAPHCQNCDEEATLIDVPSKKQYPIGDYKIIRQEALEEFSDAFNREFLTQALAQHNGNISKTARAINLSRQHLYVMINRYHLLDGVQPVKDVADG